MYMHDGHKSTWTFSMIGLSGGVDSVQPQSPVMQYVGHDYTIFSTGTGILKMTYYDSILRFANDSRTMPHNLLYLQYYYWFSKKKYTNIGTVLYIRVQRTVPCAQYISKIACSLFNL